MKLSHGIGFFVTCSIAAAGAWLGCSSSTPAGPVVDGGTSPGQDSGGPTPDTGTNPADTGTNADTGTGTDSGTPQTCTAYCAAIQTACTGNNAQYSTTAECMTACGYFPAGAKADTTGDTLGCRIYHTGLAGTATGANPHCWHAGPYGAGVCGGTCANFCALATDYCVADAGFAATPPYASLADCTTACANFATADAGTAPEAYNASGPGAGDTIDCRQYHLGAALGSSTNQGIHCPHIAAVVDGGPCN